MFFLASRSPSPPGGHPLHHPGAGVRPRPLVVHRPRRRGGRPGRGRRGLGLAGRLLLAVHDVLLAAHLLDLVLVSLNLALKGAEAGGLPHLVFADGERPLGFGDRDAVDDAVADGLVRRQVEVALEVLADAVLLLPGDPHQLKHHPVVEPLVVRHHELDVRGLAPVYLLQPSVLDKESRVRKSGACVACGAQKCPHSSSQPKIDCGDVVWNVHHGIEYSPTRLLECTRAVKVKRYFLAAVRSFSKKKECCNDFVCGLFIYEIRYEYDPFPLESSPNISPRITSTLRAIRHKRG
mmetsp:Transcript_44980/g.77550  ORF Transcript_44980/g.77550 Transcript_44980/m.77550 type:complete len:293 (-) Transcript_44980:137-1015(-)